MLNPPCMPDRSPHEMPRRDITTKPVMSLLRRATGDASVTRSLSNPEYVRYHSHGGGVTTSAFAFEHGLSSKGAGGDDDVFCTFGRSERRRHAHQRGFDSG